MVTVPGDHFGPIPPEADPRGLVSGLHTLSCQATAASDGLTFRIHYAEPQHEATLKASASNTFVVNASRVNLGSTQIPLMDSDPLYPNSDSKQPVREDMP